MITEKTYKGPVIQTVKSPVIEVTTFLWIGFVCAISFMEAWIKFRAPGVTLPLGLGIGVMVFGALNKVEWTLAIIVATSLVLSKESLISRKNLPFFIPVLILIHQTVWLLPALSIRAHDYMENIAVTSSSIHIQYVIVEFVKIVCLFYFGISQFKKVKQ